MTMFILKITLGNDAMSTGSDIANSLRDIADMIEDNGNMEHYTGDKKILDLNGNSTGFWRVK